MDLKHKEIDQTTGGCSKNLANGAALVNLVIRSGGSSENRNLGSGKLSVKEPDFVVEEGCDKKGTSEILDGVDIETSQSCVKLPDANATETVIHMNSECDKAENVVLDAKENRLGSKSMFIEELPKKVLQEESSRGQQSSRVACGTVPESVIHINSEQVSGRNDQLDAKDNELDSKKVLPQELTGKTSIEGGLCVIDVMCGTDGKSGDRCDGEVVCRICHLGADQSPKAAATMSDSNTTRELIRLGCECKDELGIAHRPCAEAWFKLKGNRLCEICGETVKNVRGFGDNRFMEAWNERGFSVNHGSSERGRCWQGQAFCNFLMACLVIAFVLPWFFRVNMF